MTSPTAIASHSSGRATDIRAAVPRPFVAADERHVVAGLELGDVVDERADAHLRAGQVLQDRDGAARAAGGLAHALRGLGMLLGVAVGEVQPRDVHARLDHPGERVGVARGGADGGDDLRATGQDAPRYSAAGADPCFCRVKSGVRSARVDRRRARSSSASARSPRAASRPTATSAPARPRRAGAALSACDDPTVPWQRVVRADGSLAKGDRQRRLLEAEGVPFRGARVDMRAAWMRRIGPG